MESKQRKRVEVPNPDANRIAAKAGMQVAEVLERRGVYKDDEGDRLYMLICSKIEETIRTELEEIGV